MDFNTILYNISNSMPYLFAIVPGLIDLLILFKKDVKPKNKLIFVILVILLFVVIFFYTNNLVKMPKIVDEVYADAIITLNENELSHILINKEDVNNTNKWRVIDQSILEGRVINKSTIVSLVLDEIMEEDSTNKDNSEITSNGDNTINIQNEGTINIDNSTKIIQFEDTENISVSEQLPQMPMLLNSSKKEALQIIKDLIFLYNLELNYKLNIIGNYEDEDELIVIDQVPSNGEILERGTLIQLTVTSLYDIDNSEYNTIAGSFINDISDIIDGNNYRIKHIESEKYLDVKDESMENGTIIQIWEYYPEHNHQVFKFEYIGNRKYLLRAVHSGKVIEVRNDGLNDRDPVAQWEYAELPCQQWYIEQNVDGTFSFKNVNSGLYLNVEGNYTENGSRLIQYHDDNTTANKFYIEIA